MAILDDIRAETIEQAFAPWGLERFDVDAVYDLIEENYEAAEQDAVRDRFNQALYEFMFALVSALDAGDLLAAVQQGNAWLEFLGQPLDAQEEAETVDELLRYYLMDELLNP